MESFTVGFYAVHNCCLSFQASELGLNGIYTSFSWMANRWRRKNLALGRLFRCSMYTPHRHTAQKHNQTTWTVLWLQTLSPITSFLYFSFLTFTFSLFFFFNFFHTLHALALPLHKIGAQRGSNLVNLWGNIQIQILDKK